MIGILTTDWHIKESNMDFVESVASQTIDYAKEVGEKEIYCLGDVFESRKSQTIGLLKCFERILNMFLEEGLTLRTIPGNHDKTDYSSKESFLDSFKWHPALKLHDTFHREYKILENGKKIAIDFMPFFEDTVWVEELRRGVNRETPKEENVEERYLMTHIGIEGVILRGKTLNGIPINLLTPYYKKIYIGHYHDKSWWGSNGEVQYVGATMQHNFGEDGGKGLTLVQDDGSWETVELESMKWETVEVDLEKDKVDIIDFINFKDSMTSLKIVLKGAEEKIKTFPKNLLIENGIKVEVKVEGETISSIGLVEGENENLVRYYGEKEIQKQFDFFCEKMEISEEEKLTGLNFLKTCLYQKN